MLKFFNITTFYNSKYVIFLTLHVQCNNITSNNITIEKNKKRLQLKLLYYKTCNKTIKM